jgi:hypothetical protein
MKLHAVLGCCLILAGCAAPVNLKAVKEYEPIYRGQVKGNYSALARCVADMMQSDERWQIQGLLYDVRVYPDIQKSEVHAYAHNRYAGASYRMLLSLKQSGPDTVDAAIKGKDYAPSIAQDTLLSCSAA